MAMTFQVGHPSFVNLQKWILYKSLYRIVKKLAALSLAAPNAAKIRIPNATIFDGSVVSRIVSFIQVSHHGFLTLHFCPWNIPLKALDPTPGYNYERVQYKFNELDLVYPILGVAENISDFYDTFGIPKGEN
jgi:hypothetical protein